MKEIELRALDLELNPDLEELEEIDGLRLHGYVATDAASHILGKEGKKKWREVIAPGTFQKAIAKARRLKESIDFLVDHDTKKILASTENDSLFLEEDEVGLYFDAKISETSFGKDLYVLVRDGIIKGLSFGMKVLDENWSLASDGMPLRTIHEIELYEISALKTPAYPTTLLEARGIEVADVEVPEIETKDNELRSLIGGNSMNNEQEVTPKMVYDAISTLAMNQAETNKLLQEIVDKSAFEGLEMAKQVMEQVQQVASAQVPALPADQMTPPAEPAQPGEEVREEVTTEAKPVKGQPTEEKPADEQPAPKEGEETRAEEKPAEEKAPEVDEDTKPTEEAAPEAKPADEKPVEKPTEEAAKPVDQKPAEEAKPTDDEDEEKKKQATEIRAWLENHKIVEVPEHGN